MHEEFVNKYPALVIRASVTQRVPHKIAPEGLLDGWRTGLTLALASSLGWGNSIFLSSRPDLIRAGSRMSARLVAAMI